MIAIRFCHRLTRSHRIRHLADAVGYDDPLSLSRILKAATGMNPGAFCNLRPRR